VIEVKPTGILDAFAEEGLTVSSMGRPASDDPVLFEAAATAALVALDEAGTHG